MALYNKHFYHQIIRKYVIAFGTLFSNINVLRKNSNGDELSRENVPITFSPKEKFYQRLVQDYEKDSRISIKLPHIAFEIIDYNYDSERKLSSKRTVFEKTDDGNSKFFYNPVPYNIGFNLYVFSKSQEEGLQIIEQILPFFTPDYVLTLKLTELDTLKTDIPITLNSVSFEDTYEGDFESRRSIIWTLNFTLKGYLLGPLRTKKFILHTRINSIATCKFLEQFVEPPIVDNSLQKYPTIEEYFEFDGIGGKLQTFKENKDFDTNNLIVQKSTGSSFFIEVFDEFENLFDFTDYNLNSFFKKSLSNSNINVNASSNLNGIIKVEITKEILENVEIGLYKFTVSAENKYTNDLIIVVDGFINIV